MRSNTELFIASAGLVLLANKCGSEIRLKREIQDIELRNQTLQAELDYQKQAELNLQYKLAEISKRSKEVLISKEEQKPNELGNICQDL